MKKLNNIKNIGFNIKYEMVNKEKYINIIHKGNDNYYYKDESR